MNIEARIEKIMDEQVISDRFRKREFVVQTKEQFNIRGREWTPPQGGATRYYTTLQAWRMSPLQQEAAAPAPPSDLPPAGQPFTPSGDDSVLDDDLPF